VNTMANMNDRYMEEYEAARSGRPSIQETLTKAQEQERKKKRHRYEKIGAALLKCTLFTGHPVRRVHFALYD